MHRKNHSMYIQATIEGIRHPLEFLNSTDNWELLSTKFLTVNGT